MGDDPDTTDPDRDSGDSDSRDESEMFQAIKSIFHLSQKRLMS